LSDGEVLGHGRYLRCFLRNKVNFIQFGNIGVHPSLGQTQKDAGVAPPFQTGGAAHCFWRNSRLPECFFCIEPTPAAFVDCENSDGFAGGAMRPAMASRTSRQYMSGDILDDIPYLVALQRAVLQISG
jgi:hypothetical protein